MCFLHTFGVFASASAHLILVNKACAVVHAGWRK